MDDARVRFNDKHDKTTFENNSFHNTDPGPIPTEGFETKSFFYGNMDKPSWWARVKEALGL